MISLTFTQSSTFSVASIPEQWRKYVTVRKRISTSGTIIYDVSIDIAAEDSSYRYRALMQKPQLVLKFSLPFFIEFPVGTTCIFQNQRFILTKPENLKKQGSRNIEYSMTLGTNEDFMGVWKLRNSVDRRLKFSMCAKPHEFVEEIVKNLNKKDTSLTWQVGECIEATEKTVEFNHAYIDAALTDICNVFETEYEVEYVGTTVAKIHLRKVEYFKDSPVALSYGRGNGFVPGVGRSSETGGEPVKRLYVQGTDRNIDRSKYGSPELLLPKNQTLEYEGRTYRASDDGSYIERVDKISSAIKEDSLDCSEIYPSRVGTVTSVVAVKPEKNLYDIIDNTIPATLNFNNYLIAGESMTLIFQSGMLAGKEFDIKYKHDERRFEIVPQEIDGVTMPNETYKPNADSANPDTYAIFGCMLPDDYICNNAEKTGASWDMFREAAKALYECEDQKFTFTGQLQALWTKRNWLAVGGHLVVGGYVLFTDNQFAVDGVKIRITGIKDYINKPYAPTIELSNSVSGASVSSQLRQIENTEVVIDDTKRGIIEFTKRRFRDAKETIEMLEDAMLDNFTNSISPITVQTMAMLVGDESLQFQFVGIDSNGNQAVRVDSLINYNQEKKQLMFVTPTAGMYIYLKHLTLGINNISSSHDDTEYKKWKMKPYTSPVLSDGSKRYYLYAKCYTDESLGGELVLSENAIKMEEVSNCYHFLVGVLNSESEGERSFVSLYGFTEILPGRITTDRIVSGDGESFLDLISGAMKLGDCLDYNTQGDKTLRLKFLLSENANLGGWIFKNNRLESQNGKLYLDGVKGEVNVGGVIRYATAFQGKLTDANLIWLPQTTEMKTITVMYEKEHLGKVIKCFNSNPFGGKNWRIALREYTYSEQDASDGIIGSGYVNDTYEVIVRPQETVEIAYLEKPYTGGGLAGSFAGRWELVGRFSQELFINDTDMGRFPRLISMGRMVYNNGSPYISGDWWDSSLISSKLSVERKGAGKYRISFAAKDVPSGYKLIVSGYGAIAGGSNSIKAGVYETASTYFDVYTSDDASLNDGSFDFIIFAPNWWYNLKST